MQEITNKDATATLVSELLKEKRSERRWKNIRFIFWFILIGYLIIGIFTYLGSSPVSVTGGKYTALVRIDGMIAPGTSYSAESMVPVLHDAFADKNAEGVVIDINSPGGTPVQSAIIHDTIIAYKNKYKKKVIIVGEDLLASGAYYVAVAGDKIYVNPNSITGSVGVIMKGFGFVDALKKLGVERRVYTAGTNKDRLDPFLPQNPDDVAKIQKVMTEVHKNFVQAVLVGRKGKLHADPVALFNGDFWSGQTALQLGLVDNLGNLMDAMDKEFKTTKYKEYGATPDFLRLLGGQVTSSINSVVYSFS